MVKMQDRQSAMFIYILSHTINPFRHYKKRMMSLGEKRIWLKKLISIVVAFSKAIFDYKFKFYIISIEHDEEDLGI